MMGQIKARGPFHIFGAIIVLVLRQNRPGNSWIWGGTSGMSHRAAAWRRPTSFVSEKRRKEADRQAERQTVRETESCGNGDFKLASLVSGTGRQSTQNK